MKIVKFFLLPLVTLIGGILIGIIVRDFPLFTINYNLKITEVISVLLTFGIGIFIPLVVKKLIDDRRSFKNSLIEEIGAFVKTASRINERITTIFESSKISQRDKDDMNLLFEIADDEFNSLYLFIETHCKDGTKKELLNLKEKWIEYWKILTGTEVTKSEVKRVEEATFKKAVKNFNELKGIVRNVKTQLNEL
jgi:hypothetical protein